MTEGLDGDVGRYRSLRQRGLVATCVANGQGREGHCGEVVDEVALAVNSGEDRRQGA